jgi:enamine deaminase RidA (YjgF/YER057c/UK114 family)/catechol 2,3-dioxygenase-like lactoylglutathione lyase family enzyme
MNDSQASDGFHVDQIDHVELFVPDRHEAAKWYERVLGLKIVREYEHWAADPRGPLMISSDTGNTKLALFQGTPQGARETAGYHLVAFRVGAVDFKKFLDRLPQLKLIDHRGQAVTGDLVRDHTAAYSLYFNDPFGHRLGRPLSTRADEETAWTLTVKKQAVNPPSVFRSLEHGFSQAVIATGSKTLHVSGQTAWDSSKRLVGGADLEPQARQAFANLRSVVEAAGATMADVVSVRIYIVDYRPEKAASVGRAFRECFTGDIKPASTWVGVAALADPGFLIEVEATAVFD